MFTHAHHRRHKDIRLVGPACGTRDLGLTDRSATARALDGLAERYAFDCADDDAACGPLARVQALALKDVEVSFRAVTTASRS
jgi:hypothetical protein